MGGRLTRKVQFIWMLLQNRVCTREFLLHRNLKVIVHLFLHCDDVWKLWMKFTKWLDCSWIMPQECNGDRDIPTKSNYFAFAWHFTGQLDIKK